MLASLSRQLFYSRAGLLFFAGFNWLLFLFHSSESVKQLGHIGYFEEGKYQYFPVKHISKGAFTAIHIGFPLALLLFGVLSLRFSRSLLKEIPNRLYTTIYKIRNFVSSEISNLSSFQKLIAGLTFLIVAAERLYYLFRFPIHTDEAASYLLFIRHGTWATATFYPVPNNHILQNLLAIPLTLFFQDPFWVLRLPPIFFSFLVSFAGFLILKRFADFSLAFLTTALFSFNSFTLFMSTQGRGYMLLTLLTLLAFGCMIQALKTRRAVYWTGFSIFSALGFYTVPTYLYPFASLLLFGGIYLMLHKNWKEFPAMALSTLIALIGTLILYVPLLLVSGRKALFNNKYVQALSWQQFKEGLFPYYTENQGYMLAGKFTSGFWVFAGVCVLLAFLLLFRKRSGVEKLLPGNTPLLAGFVLAGTATVLILLRLQLLLPPPRVLFYKSFFDLLGAAIVLAIPFRLLLKNGKLQALSLFLTVLVFAFVQIRPTEAFLKDYPQPYYNFPALVKQIKASGAQKVYLDEPFYQLFLQYEYSRTGEDIWIDSKKANASTYDYVVLEHGKSFPANLPTNAYQQVYSDELVTAFRRKDLW